jgi:hypothetical protein
MTLRKFQPTNTFQVAMAVLIEDNSFTGQRPALVRERPRGHVARAVASRGLGILLLSAMISAVVLPAIGVAALLGALGTGSAILLALALWVALPTLAVAAVAVCALLDDHG